MLEKRMPATYCVRSTDNVTKQFEIKALTVDDLNDTYNLRSACMPNQTHLCQVIAKHLRGADYKSTRQQIHNLGLWLRTPDNGTQLIGFCLAVFENEASLSTKAYKISTLIIKDDYMERIHLNNLILTALQSLSLPLTEPFTRDNVKVICKVSEENHFLIGYLKNQDIFHAIKQNKHNITMVAKLSILEKKLNIELMYLKIHAMPLILSQGVSMKRQYPAYLEQETISTRQRIKLIN